MAQIALEKLCPAVYALLSDGLHPSLHSLFGKINNSVWRVVEVTSQISESSVFFSFWDGLGGGWDGGREGRLL